MADNDKVWQKLYSYETEIFAFIKNAVGDADIAKDLFQDIYLSALKNLSNLDPHRSLKNWLFTTTRNRVINYFRFNSKREFSEIKEDSLQTKIKHSDDAELISRVLNQLPLRQKMVLLLREVDGFSYQEISQQLNLSVSAVTALLSRARENFQKNYVIQLLPDWFMEIEGMVELSDIFRFINPFNPPLDIIELIDARRTKYFASKTSGWDKIRDSFFNSSDLDHILGRFELKDGQQTADLGCGLGFVSLPLTILGQKVVAIDADPGMIMEINRTKTEIDLENLNPVIADIRQLPFQPDSFDNMFLVLVLHHVPNPFLVIEHCASILKESGRIIIVDLIKHRRRELADQMHDLWLGFNPDSLARRIKKSGLDLVDNGLFKSDKKLVSFYQIWRKR